MGNCLDGGPKDATADGDVGQMDKSAINKDQHKKKVSAGTSGRSSVHSIHGGMMRERNIDVYKKYQEVEVLGTGSMGHVAKVQVKDGEEGGSAYRPSASVDSDGTNGKSSRRNNSNGKTLLPATSVLSERRKNKVDYALKSIQLERVSPSFVDELKNEIEILKAMDHPNIVRLHEVYYHKKQIYLILELCDGGDLYTRLPYTEKDGAYITGKLLSAIKYMHDHGIVHRDCEYLLGCSLVLNDLVRKHACRRVNNGRPLSKKANRHCCLSLRSATVILDNLTHVSCFP